MTTQTKEKYYIQVYGKDGKPTFKEVKGEPVQIKGAKDADLFLHRDENGYWRVSAGVNGMALTRGQDTKKEAIADASVRGKPQRAVIEIKRYIERGEMISPRHQTLLQKIKNLDIKPSGKKQLIKKLVEKEPWQMTREEWYGQLADSQPREGISRQERIKEISEAAFKHVGVRYTTHYKKIQQALSEGKPVPSEVLKDYPELKGKGKSELRGNLKWGDDISVNEIKVGDYFDRPQRLSRTESPISGRVKKINPKNLVIEVEYGGWGGAKSATGGKHNAI